MGHKCNHTKREGLYELPNNEKLTINIKYCLKCRKARATFIKLTKIKF